MHTQDTDFARNIVKSISYLERHRRRFINEHLEQYGLRGSMFLTLMFLNRCPGSSQDKLCGELLIDKGNAARMCRRLEEMGYICRSQSEADRRQNELYLTDSGKEQVGHIKKLLGEWKQIATSGISDEECQMLTALLLRMRENVSNL